MDVITITNWALSHASGGITNQLRANRASLTCKTGNINGCTEGCEDWPQTFSPRLSLWRHPLK